MECGKSVMQWRIRKLNELAQTCKCEECKEEVSHKQATRQGCNMSISSESKDKAPLSMSYPFWFPVRGTDRQDYDTDGKKVGRMMESVSRNNGLNVCFRRDKPHWVEIMFVYSNIFINWSFITGLLHMIKNILTLDPPQNPSDWPSSSTISHFLV